MSRFRSQAAALATILTLGLATPALTAPAPGTAGLEPHSVRVEYGDLDLATAKGQQRLERRLRSAVREVCGASVPVSGTRVQSPQVTRCMALARAGALEQYAALVSDARAGG